MYFGGLLSLCVLCLGIAAAEYDLDFGKWLDEHGHSFDSVDYETWKSNKEFVEMHRQQKSSFTVSLNKFAHLTPKDLVQEREDLFKPLTASTHKDSVLQELRDPPADVDWRTKGVVAPVEDQSAMFSSYAFTAADTVTSFLAIKTGNLVALSADEVTDCCHYHPCSGRFTTNSFTCIHGMGGLCSRATYNRDTNCACHNTTCTPIGIINGGKIVPRGSETGLAIAVAMQPVQVVVDAGHSSFQMYKSGVYDEPLCSSARLDHSMLLVGYGITSEGQEYWIVKNSWGVNWGVDGYILMSKNKDNQCGIASSADYPY